MWVDGCHDVRMEPLLSGSYLGPLCANMTCCNCRRLNLTIPASARRKTLRLFMRSGVLRQENRKQGVQGCLAASSDVVQALKEGQVEGEFFLGNPPVWAQPGAQQ